MAVSLVSASRFSGLGRVFAHSGGQQNAVLSFDVYGLCDVGGNPCGPCDFFMALAPLFTALLAPASNHQKIAPRTG